LSRLIHSFVLEKSQTQGVPDETPHLSGVKEVTLSAPKVYEERNHQHRHQKVQEPIQNFVKQQAKTDTKHSRFSRAF